MTSLSTIHERDDTSAVFLHHANIPFNSVLLLHNSLLLFPVVTKCPSSLWTQCHDNNPRLITIVIIITVYVLLTFFNFFPASPTLQGVQTNLCISQRLRTW